MIMEKIPYDIIINNIIPFTYRTMPREILSDIISFTHDLNIILNIYSFDYNLKLLINDLINFFYQEKILVNYSYNKVTDKIRFLWGLMTINQRNKFINNLLE